MKDMTRMILIIISGFLILFLIGVLIWGIQLDRKKDHFLKTIQEETYPIENLEEIVVKTKSDDVKIYHTEENLIRIVAKGTEKETFSVHLNQGSLEIISQESSRFCIGFCFKEMMYEIYIPRSYQKKLRVETLSGDIDFDTVDSEQFLDLYLKTTSGDIMMNSGVLAEQVHLQSVSGDIQTNSIQSSNIEIRTSSGEIENRYLEGNIYLKTISADIENDYVKGSLETYTTSGDIEIDYFDVLGNSKIHSTSGDIEVSLNPKTNVKMITNTVSGDVRLSSGSIIGDGSYTLDLKTISGDIETVTR